MLIAGCAVGACAGTGNTGPQAPEWLVVDSVPTPSGCPNLAGQFENRASAVYPDRVTDGVSLTDIFRAMARGVAAREREPSWSVPIEATHVSIEQSAEVLTLTFLGKDGESTSQVFRRLRVFRRNSRLDDTFACNSSKGIARLSFPMAPVQQQTDSAAPLYVGASDVHVRFFKARDGALIMQTVSDKMGLSAVIIGTHFSRDSSWSRFAPVEGTMQPVVPQIPGADERQDSY